MHVINDAFINVHKHSGWEIHKLRRCLYWLFKDTPARRSKFTEVTGKTKFSKKTCQVRWTDNSNTAQVAFDVLDSVIKFIETTYKIPKRNSNENKVISNYEISLSLGNHH